MSASNVKTTFEDLFSYRKMEAMYYNSQGVILVFDNVTLLQDLKIRICGTLAHLQNGTELQDIRWNREIKEIGHKTRKQKVTDIITIAGFGKIYGERGANFIGFPIDGLVEKYHTAFEKLVPPRKMP